MIISHLHKFIFIKTHCTAGTSMEVALSRICGVGDVITPLPNRAESLRREQGGRTAQNYRWSNIPFPVVCEILQCTSLPERAFEIGSRFAASKEFEAYDHIPSSCVRRLLHPDIWESYFKFCVERDPIGKVYAMHQKAFSDKSSESVDNFVYSGRHTSGTDFDMYVEKGKLLVDNIFQFDELDRWWPELLARVGVEENIALPKPVATNQGKPQGDLGGRAMRQISVDFAREISLFGYSPSKPGNTSV